MVYKLYNIGFIYALGPASKYPQDDSVYLKADSKYTHRYSAYLCTQAITWSGNKSTMSGSLKPADYGPAI